MSRPSANADEVTDSESTPLRLVHQVRIRNAAAWHRLVQPWRPQGFSLVPAGGADETGELPLAHMLALIDLRAYPDLG